MQIITRMDMVVIEGYYHNNGLKTNWIKLTQLSSFFFLPNLMSPFCTSTFTSNFLMAFLQVHTREKNMSPLFILCTQMPQIIPFLTLTLLHTCYESTPPWIQNVFHVSLIHSGGSLAKNVGTACDKI